MRAWRLRVCDINFVRGLFVFCKAQWARCQIRKWCELSQDIVDVADARISPLRTCRASSFEVLSSGPTREDWLPSEEDIRRRKRHIRRWGHNLRLAARKKLVMSMPVAAGGAPKHMIKS